MSVPTTKVGVTRIVEVVVNADAGFLQNTNRPFAFDFSGAVCGSGYFLRLRMKLSHTGV